DQAESRVLPGRHRDLGEIAVRFHSGSRGRLEHLEFGETRYWRGNEAAERASLPFIDRARRLAEGHRQQLGSGERGKRIERDRLPHEWRMDAVPQAVAQDLGDGYLGRVADDIGMARDEDFGRGPSGAKESALHSAGGAARFDGGADIHSEE